jgi:hypothetical protein
MHRSREYSQSTQTWRFAQHHSKFNEIVTQNYYLLTAVCVSQYTYDAF